MLLDEHGNPIGKGPGVSGQLDRLLSPGENVFEGVVNMKLYDDAIECKATCAHCLGPMEGVLKFPRSYLRNCGDREERIKDAQAQVIARVKRDHFCIARIEGPKLPILDFLRRFH